MKKVSLSIVTLLLCFVCLFSVACGGPRGDSESVGGSSSGGGDSSVSNSINYNGTININLPTSEFVYEDVALKKVAAEYMSMHPETTINVEQWTSATYKDNLDSQFTGGAQITSADIVQTLLISNTYLTTKMVDYSSYLVKKNPYSDNKVWKDTLEEEAYPLSLDRSGIYSLNYTTSQSFFFYNKDLWRQAGLVNADGTDKIPATWDELVTFCQQIEEKTSAKEAISLSGATYTTGAMSWLLNIYTDQYYRSIVENCHAVAGDYCYDPDIDSDWSYDPADKNNDSPSKYTLNSLRFYKMLMENEAGPNDAKYKAMLKNLKKVIPSHVQSTFVSDNHYQASNHFWAGEAALVYNTTDFFNTYKNIFADGGMYTEKFDVGFFEAPPMTGSGEEAPDCDTVRSVGGAVGYYGVVKKDKEHNDLVMDFMMFWGSKRGQDIYNASLKSQQAYIGGASLIKNVDTPEDILPSKDYAFPGLCHNNPMGQFFGNVVSMNGALSAYQMYESLTKNLFNDDSTIDKYCSNLTKAIQAGIPIYFQGLGWQKNAYDTPEKAPTI